VAERQLPKLNVAGSIPVSRSKFVFEVSVFNAVNHVWSGSTSISADGSIGQSVTSSIPTSDTSLGTVAGQANNPRQWQFAGHINF
jgi:hypothetical protein